MQSLYIKLWLLCYFHLDLNVPIYLSICLSIYLSIYLTRLYTNTIVFSNPLLSSCFNQPKPTKLLFFQMPSNKPASSSQASGASGSNRSKRLTTSSVLRSSCFSVKPRGVPGGEIQIQWPSSPASFRGMST